MSFTKCSKSSESFVGEWRFVHHTFRRHTSLLHSLFSSGVFIKMGQHIASLVVLPVEWTSTMKVLQDKCEPTLYEDLETLFLNDMGAPISELFDDFDPEPIGVASLAQVHIGRHKASGQTVAVKVYLKITLRPTLINYESMSVATSSSSRVL